MSIFKHKEQVVEAAAKPLSLKDMQEVIVEEGFEIFQVNNNSIGFKDENIIYRVIKDFKMIFVDLGFSNSPDPNLAGRSNYLNAF